MAVDDNREILALVHRAAVSAGHEVEVVTSGAQFMTAYSRFKPDVVIIDIVMPDIDGIELLRWLYDVQSSARVIIISGDISGSYGSIAKKLAEAHGGSSVSVLAKPFRLTELVTAIEGR